MEKEVEKNNDINVDEILDEQPIVLNLDKKQLKGEPRLKAEGALFDYEGFIRNFTKDFSMTLSFLGAILVYLSPFSTWIKQTVGKTVTKADLLDIAGKNGEIALNQNGLFVFGLIIIIVAVSMLILTAREYIRPLRPHADNYFLRFVPVIIAIAMYVLTIKNKAYVAICKYDYIETGLGQIFCVMGIVLYAMSVIFDLMNRDDR